MNILQKLPADSNEDEVWKAFNPYGLLPKDKAYW